MRKIRLFPIILLSFLILVCAKSPRNKNEHEGKKQGKALYQNPIGICFVKEMDFIPEYDSWSLCTTEVLKEITNDMHVAWKKAVPEVEKLLTPVMVQVLSQWAQEQMKEYDSIPSLSNISFKPVREYNDQHKLVYEAIVDTLPTHSEIVTRCLKIYVLYEKALKSITRTTVTIRGEMLE